MIYGQTKGSLSMGDMTIAKLRSMKSKFQILEQLATIDEERAEYERYWPFR